MTARAIMVLGTGSNVGKSLIVAGLARAFANRGLKVAPFKPQNMSNNAAVTANGGEIGRAQALQARAARVEPSVHMNPLLLKPESENGAQVILQGKRLASLKARDFFATRITYMPAILDSFAKLAAKYDLILVEGAGSPAEINLRQGDLANLGFAEKAGIPAVIVGDISRGGVIASLVGTMAVLGPSDRGLIKGFIINKFHGDPQLFDEGLSYLNKTISLPCLGIVPNFANAHLLPPEDSLVLEDASPGSSNQPTVAVLKLPRIANFDDLGPLSAESNINLQMVMPGRTIPPDALLVIIPGSKSTIADLAALRAEGWDIDLLAHHRRGGRVLGLCGGYQMLGKAIHDPAGLEGPSGSVQGLGLLEVETILEPAKITRLTQARHLSSGQPLSAYEIHLGRTTGTDCARAFADIAGEPEGATSPDGLVVGTYLHGFFTSDGFRKDYLAALGIQSLLGNYEAKIEETLEALADHLSSHLNLDLLLSMAGEVHV